MDEHAKSLIESMCNFCLKRMLTLTQTCQKTYLNTNENIYKSDYKSDSKEGCGICFAILGRFSSVEFLNEVFFLQPNVKIR